MDHNKSVVIEARPRVLLSAFALVFYMGVRMGRNQHALREAVVDATVKKVNDVIYSQPNQ